MSKAMLHHYTFASTTFRSRALLYAACSVIALLGASAAHAAPVVNAVSSSNADSATHTISHTVAGADRLLTVCVVFDDTSTSVSNVVFNGSEGLTKVTQVLHAGGKPRVELWRRTAPTATTANVVVTLSSAKKTTVGVISYTGVDQTTPIDGATIASAITNTATVNVPSATGDLVADCMGTIAIPVTPPTVGTFQTSRWTREQGGSIRGAGSTEPGTGTVTMSWGLPESKEWATIGFNINAQNCGNGVVNAGESCDDGAANGTTASCCTTTCAYKSNGTACGSAGDTICDNPDTCNATGTCMANNEPGTTVCRADAGACDVAENCSSGSCPADAFEPAATPCGNGTDSICDNPDSCNASGSCVANNEPDTTTCRADAGDCDVAESCDGDGACPADSFEPAATACGNDGNTICDNPDSCDAGGNCLVNNEPASVQCRADAGPCDVAETCDGSGACPTDAFEPAETACGSPNDSACDNPDTCDSSGACQLNNEPNTFECRPAAGDCDVAETCDGAGGACPADAFQSADTACGSDNDSICDDPDSCDAGGNCLANNEPDTVECRADAGDCDVAESCDGSGACPADAFEPAETTCGDTANAECDNPDSCDASGNCQDNFEPAATNCGDAGDSTCDNPDTCDGSGDCLANNEPGSVECRAAASDCDVAESCDGAGACPADAFEPATTSCGSASDTTCDNADTCDSGGNCLANNEPGTTECRADAGDCDLAENCDGAGACPADAFEPAATACGDADDSICDNPDSCDGSGDCLVNNEPGTVECRADAGNCDVAESCDGAGACPADAFEAAATACGDPGDTDCDNPDSCDAAGNCEDNFESAAASCGDQGETSCDNPDTCDGSGACNSNFETAATACGDPGDSICDNPDACDGSGDCLANNEPGTTECRADAGMCDIAEQCDGAGACPADAFEPVDTACGNPGDSICDSPDTCDGSGSCLVNNEPGTVECRSDAGPCDVAETCDGAGACPADAFEPAATPCGDPANTDCDDPDSCDGSGTCASNPASNGTTCNDGAFCNGADTCSAGICSSHAGDPCSGPDGDTDCSEACNEGADACTANDTDGTPCDDGDVCSSGETCSAGSCSGGAATTCDDNNLCTVDSCDPIDGCIYEGEPVDAGSCLAPGKFSFAVKNGGEAAKNSIKWGWKKGQPVDPMDLGSPTATTSFSLCVFDTGDVTELVASYSVAPSATLWVTKPGQINYADKPGAFDGITSIKGKASLDPLKSSMGWKGAGVNLTLPAALGTEFFDVDATLIVQMLSSDGACWTSELTPLHVKKNTAALFKSTGP